MLLKAFIVANLSSSSFTGINCSTNFSRGIKVIVSDTAIIKNRDYHIILLNFPLLIIVMFEWCYYSIRVADLTSAIFLRFAHNVAVFLTSLTIIESFPVNSPSRVSIVNERMFIAIS